MSRPRTSGIYLYRRIVLAKIFIDKNFDRNIPINEIAEKAFFSKFHFIRLFKTIYGKTPHQYLIKVRIENAMLLLKANIPVSDTCYRVGFESLGSFTVLFKKLVGMTPSEYLLRQQLMKAQIYKTPLKFVPGCFAKTRGWLENSNFQEMSF